MKNNRAKMKAIARLKRTLPLLLAVFGLCIGVHGQGITGDMSIPAGLPAVIPPSPTVAALMKFEEVPVNNYNGVPDINIPIYSAKANGGISLDIKLGYHPANINANLAASDCGLGWSLFAGGSISRTVRGLPDEVYIPGNKLGIYRTEFQSGNNINYFYSMSRWIDEGIHFSPSNQLTTFRYMWDVMIGGKMDTEHDLYQYNFMGYSGRFIVQKNTNGSLEVIKLDKNPLKIVNFYDASSFVPNYFEITDDKGVKYRFDVTETTTVSNMSNTESSNGSGNQNTTGTTGPSYRSAFHLSKVYDSANILAVDLRYTNDNKTEKTASRSSTSTRLLYEDMSTIVNNLDYNGLIGEFNPLPSKSTSTTQQTTVIRKLSRINVIGQGRIDFNYTTGRPDTNIMQASGSYKLNQITVKTWKDSVQQRRFGFVYDISQMIDTRMTLAAVNVFDKANAFEYDYKLFYKQPDAYNPDLLGKDFWGYINQKPPYITALYRETTPEYCTVDALELMKIPTGGAIKFNFEPNTYSYIGSEPVTNFDDNPDNWLHLTDSKHFSTVKNNTTYFFEFGGTNSQVVYFDASCSFAGEWRFRILRYENGSYTDVGGLWNQTSRSMTLAPGSYSVSFDTPGVLLHEYPIQAGITVYFKRKPLGTFLDPFQQRKYLYGGGVRIKSIQYYKDFNLDAINDPLFVPEKQTNYNYSFFTDGYRISGSLVYPKPVFKYVKQKRECMRNSGQLGGGNIISSDAMILTYEVETTTDNLAVIKTKGSEVGYQNVTVTETGNGRREFVYTSAIDFPETLTEFNTQFPFLPSENIDYKRGNLLSSKTYDQQSRLLDETVNTYDYVTDSGTVNTGIRFYYPGDYQFINYFRYEDYNSYIQYLNGCVSSNNCFCYFGQPYEFITFARTKESFGTANLASSLSKQYFYAGSSTTALAPVQNSSTYTYDPYNKQIKKQQVTNSLGEVTLTEYFYAKNLLSEPNATAMSNKNMISLPLKIVTTKDGEQLAEQKIVYKDWGNNLIAPELIQSSKGAGTLENRVVYSKMDNTTGNPLEVQQEGGMKICYIWGYNRTVPVAKIENIAYASIPTGLITAVETASNASVTGLETDLVTALNNLRTGLPDAFVTTMTYVPQVGAKVVTDPKGIKKTYSYDNSGRLQNVKNNEGQLISQHSYNYRP